MNNTILVPIDFSDHSFQTALLSLNMAGRLSKSVVFLYITNNLEIKIGEQIDRLQAQISSWITQGKAAEVPFSIEIRSGVPEEQIKQYIQHYEPWIVLMSTRGKARKIQDLIGSVTAEVLDGASVPVLAIPEQYSWSSLRGVKRISYATSFHSNEAKFIQLLADLLPKDSLESLTFIHYHKAGESSYTDDQQALSDAVSLIFPSVRMEFQYQVFKDGFEEDFSEFLATDPSDLVVIKNSHCNIIRRTLHSGLAKRLAFNAAKPILVL